MIYFEMKMQSVNNVFFIRLLLLLSFVTGGYFVQPPVDSKGNPLPPDSPANKTKEMDWWAKIKQRRKDLEKSNINLDNTKSSVPPLSFEIPHKKGNSLDNESYFEKTLQNKTSVDVNKIPLSKVENPISRNEYINNKQEELKGSNSNEKYSPKTTDIVDLEKQGDGNQETLHSVNSSHTFTNNTRLRESRSGANNSVPLDRDVNSSMANCTGKTPQEPCYGNICTHVILVASSLYFYHTVTMF